MINKLMSTALLLGLTVFIAGCSTEAEAPVEDTVKEVPLALELMKKDVIEQTYVSVGEVVTDSQVDYFIAGGGFIETVLVEAGDYVEEGMILVQLDGSEMDMTNYNATESQLRTIRDNLGSQLSSSRESYERQEALYQDGIITKLELDQSLLQVENLEREYANARSSYSNQLTIIKDGLEDAVDSRVIESAISGTVAAVYIKDGEQASGQLGLTIIDDQNLLVKTYIGSDMKKQIGVGDYVRLKMDGREEQVTIGEISDIQTLPDPVSKLFEVTISFEMDSQWIIGDYTEVEFIIDRYEAVLVPSESVVRKGTDKYIYTYDSGELTLVAIETGRSKEDWIEVIDMPVITQIVVRGQEQLLSDNSPFIIVN